MKVINGYSFNMKSIFFITFFSILLSAFSDGLLAQEIIVIEYNDVITCPSKVDNSSPPTFNEPECYKQNAVQIDPQNTSIWIQAKLNIPQSMQDNKTPYSVYVSGKMSSKVFFNGQYLGQNGTPSPLAKDEFPGKIDAMFYVPPNLIRSNQNELTLFLSSHHGFLNLNTPVHFIGFGTYSDPTYFIQKNIWQSFIPLGALIIGVLYFAVACFSPNQRRTNGLFLLMSIIAASQLIIELLRALLSYSYPFHDIRLLLIVSLSVAFGICLLVYISRKFELKRKVAWVAIGIILTLLGVVSFPGFDVKTAIAILIPSLFSTIIIALSVIKKRTKETWAFLFVFVLFTIIIIFNLTDFHDLLFYYIIAGVLGFLFVQQALKLSQEQIMRKQEAEQVVKLQFKLDQNEQKIKPNKIKITSAGKIELVSTDQILFCKADGDYVDIHLKEKKILLYSGSLKELEKLLPATFLRVHRSYLVNMNFILSLKSAHSTKQNVTSGSGILILNGEVEVPVSRRIMPMVRSAIS